MITSPRRISRIIRDYHRSYSAMDNDPITEYYGVSAEIGSAMNANFRRRLRDLTNLNAEEAEMIASEYEYKSNQKKLRYKNSVRLKWKETQSAKRYYDMMMRSMEVGE